MKQNKDFFFFLFANPDVVRRHMPGFGKDGTAAGRLTDASTKNKKTQKQQSGLLQETLNGALLHLLSW